MTSSRRHPSAAFWATVVLVAAFILLSVAVGMTLSPGIPGSGDPATGFFIMAIIAFAVWAILRRCGSSSRGHHANDP